VTAAVEPVLAPIAGGSPEADEEAAPTAPAAPSAGSALSAATRTMPHPEVALVAVVFSAACIFFGIIPGPLFDLAAHAGNAVAGIF
jgi:hypothetical protein